jgi:hypothetical protein
MRGQVITKLKNELPYGKCVFEDGTQILFNRHYQLLINGKPVNPDKEMRERILKSEKRWFYTDANPPWLNKISWKRCKMILTGFSL